MPTFEAAERIEYARIYLVHGLTTAESREFDTAEEAIEYGAELVKAGRLATIFHLDREIKD